ncbi:hypothetical protein [Leptospira bouyouniensis]|uniref:hypothetical protein n=1 Tax=Leptospira bouyouniensis TaxID=2484911 RepID=UPI001FC97FD2|nr:hypothetical protein [Leptospira bouyouniensis]
MNLINLKVNGYKKYQIRFLIVLFFINSILLLSDCNGSERTPFQFCDNFNDANDCTEPKTENDIVYLDQTKFKKENPSFEDFGNFLYFTARETPGFRLVLFRSWNGLSSEEFRSKYNAYLLYGNSKERMEGNSFKPNIVVSFHYLGALLKEEFRHLGIDHKPFQLEALGPITLTYLVEAPGMDPIVKKRTIQLKWK